MTAIMSGEQAANDPVYLEKYRRRLFSSTAVMAGLRRVHGQLAPAAVPSGINLGALNLPENAALAAPRKFRILRQDELQEVQEDPRIKSALSPLKVVWDEMCKQMPTLKPEMINNHRSFKKQLTKARYISQIIAMPRNGKI